MELIAQLETAFESLMERVGTLEVENKRLKEELERAKGSKEDIQAKVEFLLQKVQERLG